MHLTVYIIVYQYDNVSLFIIVYLFNIDVESRSKENNSKSIQILYI